MSQNPSFTENAEHVLDELLVGGPIRTRTITLADNQAVGALTRGAVIARHSDDTHAVVHETGNYAASKAVAILAAAADPSGGDVEALVYVEGDFNEDLLSFGGTVDADAVREVLQDRSIYLKKPVSR